MADLKCPSGMVLITPAAPHPNEPAFCINKTEVSQEDDNRFWSARLRKGFELLIKLKNGGERIITNPRKAPLQKEAKKLMKDRNVANVEIRRSETTAEITRPQTTAEIRRPKTTAELRRPVTTAELRKSETTAELKKPVITSEIRKPVTSVEFTTAVTSVQVWRPPSGPGKPAVLRNWHEARAYCQGTYPGGDLPTNEQWDNACGDKTYCTASGNLNHEEAVYDALGSGPAEVGSTPANRRGVQDMTGNVSEWLRDDQDMTRSRFGDLGPGYKGCRGGSWEDLFAWHLKGHDRYGCHHLYRGIDVGFRCVAPPMSPSTQPANDKVEAPPTVVKKK